MEALINIAGATDWNKYLEDLKCIETLSQVFRYTSPVVIFMVEAG